MASYSRSFHHVFQQEAFNSFSPVNSHCLWEWMRCCTLGIIHKSTPSPVCHGEEHSQQIDDVRQGGDDPNCSVLET